MSERIAFVGGMACFAVMLAGMHDALAATLVTAVTAAFVCAWTIEEWR